MMTTVDWMTRHMMIMTTVGWMTRHMMIMTTVDWMTRHMMIMTTPFSKRFKNNNDQPIIPLNKYKYV
jgi:hypothetical protein